MSANSPRAVVIGARCRRQGIGHHLARFLGQAGVEVAAVLGTSATTAAEAAEALAGSLDRRPEAHTDARRMLEAVEPQIAVIASPDETHAAYLGLCLEHRAHVLCEKPVCWGGPDPVGEALSYGRKYLAAGLHLVVNAQWPFTLPAYRSLFPEVDPARATRFFMRMSPASRGEAMLPAALPHPIALLLTVIPAGPTAVERVRCEPVGDSPDHLRITFEFVHAEGRIGCEVEICSVAKQPRPAGYGFDGAIAWRDVDLRDYAMRLRDRERAVPLPDPTPLLVRSFLDRIRGPAPTSLDPSLDPGMAHLVTLTAPPAPSIA